ncbi:hypothetical protein AVEN_45833-1 [Araneus ventricosus]|uniref:Tc3 transposase DNA binding domain-containing protein n=1 Tax=Araneus ventricosus TaxID=182803 RepID=A0A4Y2TSX9_ARAVE|nr:hypothetical protein AVEN_45833-1 [Araneus ventricosus]
MADYQDLSDFERGVTVGTREMRHSISEVAMEFGFLRTTISQVYREYQVSGKRSNFRLQCSRKKTLKDRTIDVRPESLNKIDVQYLLKLPRIYIMGHLQVSACELFNGPSLIWALRAEGPLVYRCLLHGTKLYASPGPDNTTVELLMTRNTLPDLTSFVSNCIGRMYVYEYGDNIINP